MKVCIKSEMDVFVVHDINDLKSIASEAIVVAEVGAGAERLECVPKILKYDNSSTPNNRTPWKWRSPVLKSSFDAGFCHTDETIMKWIREGVIHVFVGKSAVKDYADFMRRWHNENQ